MAHPDDDRGADERERREFERSLYCPKCGNKRLSIDGVWRCYGCDGAPKGGKQ